MNKSNFDRMISEFSKIHRRVLEPEVLSIYFRVCKKIPDNQANKIIDRCLEKCHYFPSPADIFDGYDETAIESRKIVKIILTEEEKERNLQRIRKAKEDLSKVKIPTRIGEVIKDLNIVNYKEEK